MVAPRQSAHFARGCAGFALGAAIGLLVSDVWILSNMRTLGVAPPNPFNAVDWIFLTGLVGVATFAHGLGRFVFRSRRGLVIAALTGVLSTLPLLLPRDAAYEAMCAPMCSGRQDVWIYVLAIAFAGGLLNRIGTAHTEPFHEKLKTFLVSTYFWAGAIVLAILALPIFVLVYHAWYQRISEQQYAECLLLAVPTKLGILEQRFGHGRQLQILEFDEFKGHEDWSFEPNPDYAFAWSTDIRATVAPETDKVVRLSCGEGW